MEAAGGRVLAETHQGIGLVTFSNPGKLNAVSAAMWRELGSVLETFAADAAVRVLVLTGAGHRAFVTGPDVAGADDAAQREYDQACAGGHARLAAFAKPVIARIRGDCLEDGLGIALCADLRIAAIDSAFAVGAARLNGAIAADTLRRLVGLLGPAHAKALLFTGARIEAEEAGRIGLVNRVVADEDLSDEVVELARAIAEAPPSPLRAAKLAMDALLPASAGPPAR